MPDWYRTRVDGNQPRLREQTKLLDWATDTAHTILWFGLREKKKYPGFDRILNDSSQAPRVFFLFSWFCLYYWCGSEERVRGVWLTSLSRANKDCFSSRKL